MIQINIFNLLELRSLIIHLCLNRSSRPIHSATPTTPEGMVRKVMQLPSFQ